MRLATRTLIPLSLLVLAGCMPSSAPGDDTGTDTPDSSKPTICTMEYDPVCGEDGQTYGNPCMAEAQGATIAYPGECEGDNDQEDDKQANTSSGQLPTPASEEENLSLLSLPAGFDIDIYGQLDEARSLEVVETQEMTVVFVGRRKGDTVYALLDTDSDYHADRTLTLASGLDSPNGVAYREGDLYVAEIDRILVFPEVIDRIHTRLEDTNEDTADEDFFTYSVWYDDLPDDAAHGWKYIAFGPDGNLYVPIGAPCNICDPGEPYAAIWSIDPATKERSLVAQGVRNTVGFDRDPSNDQLRFTDNGRDRMGDNIPGDELNMVTELGQDFGYPHCHQGDIQDPEFGQSCDQFTAPEVVLVPHVAALGMMFYDASAYQHPFPNTYDGKILIAEHGSRDRSTPIGYRIMLVDPVANTYEPFITGWLQGSDDRGRPVDIVALQDGSLLISDDSTGYVYRVWYTA